MYLFLIPATCYCFTTILKLKSKGSAPSLWKLYLEWFLINIANLLLMLFTFLTEGMMAILQPFIFVAMVIIIFTAIYNFNQFLRINGRTENKSNKKMAIVAYLVMTLCQIAMMGTLPKLIHKLTTFIGMGNLDHYYSSDWGWYSYGIPLLALYAFFLPLRLRYEPINISLAYRIIDFLAVNIVAGFIFTKIESEYNQYMLTFPLILPLI